MLLYLQQRLVSSHVCFLYLSSTKSAGPERRNTENASDFEVMAKERTKIKTFITTLTSACCSVCCSVCRQVPDCQRSISSRSSFVPLSSEHIVWVVVSKIRNNRHSVRSNGVLRRRRQRSEKKNPQRGGRVAGSTMQCCSSKCVSVFNAVHLSSSAVHNLQHHWPPIVDACRLNGPGLFFGVELAVNSTVRGVFLRSSLLLRCGVPMSLLSARFL